MQCAGDEERSVEAGPEPLTEQVVRAARRELGRVVAGIGDAEPQARGGDRQHEQNREAGDCHRPGPALDDPGPTRPHRVLGVLGALRHRQRELVDRVPDESKDGREQRDRGRHHEQHCERGTDRQAADEREPDHEQAEQGDHDGAARKQHRPATRVDRVHDRRLGIAAFVQGFSIAGADEQRVVDTDPDTDHRGHLWRERRNVGETREQGHDGETDTDPEQRGHDREAHREHRSERDEQDDHGREDADGLALGLGLIGEHRAAELDLQIGRVCLFHHDRACGSREQRGRRSPARRTGSRRRRCCLSAIRSARHPARTG